MMFFFLVRHADAENDSLTEIGRAQAKRSALFAKQLKLPIQTIFHSEKNRAKESADAFSSLFNIPSFLQIGLKPNDDPKNIQELLTINGALVVSHLPFLEKVLFDLTQEKIVFHPGAIVGLYKTNQ